MDEPRAVEFRGGAKWRAVVSNLVLAALGALLAAAALLTGPDDVTAIRVLGWYTVLAVLATVALAVAFALTTQLPTIERTRLGDQDALAVRAWPVEWWYDLALDLGLGVVGVQLSVLGLRAGAGWAALGVLVGVLGVWFLGRVALALVGRRRNDTLWLTDEDIVHDSRSGRERVPRDAVRRAWAAQETTFLLLVVDGARRSQLCPRPWRPRPGTVGADEIVMQCSRTGYTPDDLAAWLRDELDLGREPSAERVDSPVGSRDDGDVGLGA